MSRFARRFGLYERPVLDVEETMIALDAMVATASMQSRSMSVAIVDAWGGLLGAMRMDGASTQSLQYAIKKAYTSARIGSNLGEFRDRLIERSGIVNDFGDPSFVVARGGGVVVRAVSDRTVLGGIGVSGGSGDEDQAVAEAGRAALGL
jgi:uncharacterized protein GlcG (DUF336 family)